MSSQTSETTIPDPTSQEQAIMDLIAGDLLPGYLEESGYEVSRTQIPFEDTEEYKNLKAKLDALPEDGSGGMERDAAGNYVGGSRGEKERLKMLIERKREEYDPETTYDVRKLESAELEHLRSTYGENSAEYKAAKEASTQRDIATEQSEQRIYDLFMEKTEKFLNGDFSITDEQKALIAENQAPVKAALDKMFKENLDETISAFEEFEKSVNDTSMPLGAALAAVGAQIIQTGSDMEGALKTTMEANRELLKQGIEDFTGELTQKVAASAAAMGRDPSDPEYTADIAEVVSKTISSGTLNLAAMEAQGMIGIKERTGEGLERLEIGKAGLMQESARGKRDAKIETSRAKGAADVGLEEQAANMRWQVGAGMAPQQLGIGRGALEWNQTMSNMRLANAANTMGVPQGFAGYYQSDRHAQPTQTQSGGFGEVMSGILGAAGAGASIYSGFGTANALRGLANKGSGFGFGDPRRN